MWVVSAALQLCQQRLTYQGSCIAHGTSILKYARAAAQHNNLQQMSKLIASGLIEAQFVYDLQCH